MSYTNIVPRVGLGIDKEALKVAKAEAKQTAIEAAKAKIVAKTKGKLDGLASKSGKMTYAPPSDPALKATYDEQWALASGQAAPAAEPSSEAAAGDGPPVALLAGSLLAAAAGIWYWKKRRG